MAAEFGVPKFGNDCASFEDLRRNLSLLDDALGNPTVPTDPDAPTKEIVTYDPDTGELSTPGGTVISGTGAVTVGCGLVQVGDAISVNYNSDTLECVDGVLNVLPLAGEFLGVAPIVISAGNIAIETSDGLWVDGDDELAVRLATNSGLEFDGNAPGRLQDKWRYHVVKGQATANYHPGTGDTIIIDNVVAIRGESPVTSSSDTITCNTEQDIWLDDNDTVYAVYVENPADTVTTNWSVATGMNLASLLKGIDEFDNDKNFSIQWDHDANKLKWIDGGAAVFGKLNAALSSSDETGTMDGLTSHFGETPDEPLTFQNTFGWNGSDDADAYAVRLTGTTTWNLLQLRCS